MALSLKNTETELLLLMDKQSKGGKVIKWLRYISQSVILLSPYHIIALCSYLIQ